jgi:heme exporter protein A
MPSMAQAWGSACSLSDGGEEREMRITAHELTCVRGGRLVFSGLSFALAPGDTLLVTGPNGAGKSSLLRLVAGLLKPARGSLTVDGAAAATRPIGGALHLVGHRNAVKSALTVARNLLFWRDFLGGSGDVGKALAAFGLSALADAPAALLSAGQRRRLALARLLVASRPLWLLDEPGAALDSEGRGKITSLIAAHCSEGGIAVVAGHGEITPPLARVLALGGGGA